MPFHTLASTFRQLLHGSLLSSVRMCNLIGSGHSLPWQLQFSRFTPLPDPVDPALLFQVYLICPLLSYHRVLPSPIKALNPSFLCHIMPLSDFRSMLGHELKQWQEFKSSE